MKCSKDLDDKLSKSKFISSSSRLTSRFFKWSIILLSYVNFSITKFNFTVMKEHSPQWFGHVQRFQLSSICHHGHLLRNFPKHFIYKVQNNGTYFLIYHFCLLDYVRVIDINVLLFNVSLILPYFILFIIYHSFLFFS